MNTLLELIKYVLLEYPKPEELSKPRLVKLIYLIDWKYAIDYGKQVTNINWVYNHYGPYVDDVINLMKENPDLFEIKTRQNPYGGVTDKFQLLNRNVDDIQLQPEVKKTADLIIKKTSHLSWTKFISLVYSSYPIKSNLQYSFLDLEKLSIEFNSLKSNLAMTN
ncbi:Panacea domain-containing protein [Pontibacter ruber]|uniref:Panacea domain-containing protein n=1 Tax=Pontibacter ruber TaxID=1343895 RepID=A0ABW5CYU7_9BACT|nr:Panacea domain-containing protein [Pontibacter ruber]